LRLFGLNMNFDFAQQWDFKESIGGLETSFWFGRRF
jgi:hypothetical protein